MLVVAHKASRDEVQVFKTHMEQPIADLLAKLQPETPPEVRAQRSTLVTAATNVITGKIVQGAQLLETAMQLWTKVQRDPIL